jgi:hypothetical protein
VQQPTTTPAGYVSDPYTVVDGVLTLAPAPAPATLAQMARLGVHHQVRPPKYRLTGPISDPQHFALHIAAVNGRICRGGRDGQAPVRVLTALARKGYLNLTAHPGARRSNWTYGQITDAGRRELARLDAQHAEQVRRQAARAPKRPASITGMADPFALCRDNDSAALDAAAAAFTTS